MWLTKKVDLFEIDAYPRVIQTLGVNTILIQCLAPLNTMLSGAIHLEGVGIIGLVTSD